MRISKRLLPSGLWCVCLLVSAGTALSAAAQTTAPNEWTWMGGSNTVGTNSGQPGVYGTLGTPAIGNAPGSRTNASSWTDSGGNFWLFGGDGTDANGAEGDLNDLWEFSPSTKEWAWISGSSTTNSSYGGQPGVYGTLGTPAVGNVPGSRDSAASSIDADGHLWLFGGYGYDANGLNGDLNDLWEFNPSTKEWTWMGGSNTLAQNGVGQGGVYGTLGTPAAGNNPGGRYGATAWTDQSGNFWLFGGFGIYANNIGSYISGWLNDLWEFNPSSREWAWMGGSSMLPPLTAGGQPDGPPGAYGTMGTPAAGNTPGGRYGAVNWTDSQGNFWLFGGNGFDAGGNSIQYLNDLWEFNPSTLEWVWVSGSSTGDQPGVYGTLGTPAAGNNPGGRYGATVWTDQSGNFWLFGGENWTVNSVTAKLSYLWFNDLWEFIPSTNQWAWMGGSSTEDQPGVYGALGTPAAGNTPGGRAYSVNWTDSNGNLWLLGGEGYDAIDSQGNLNDLWVYSLPITATPTFSPVAGTYNAAQTIAISDTTPGVTIYYTTNGDTPTADSTVYTKPLTVSATETIVAMAASGNNIHSKAASASYTINLPDFTLSAAPSSISVTAGQSGTTTITVQDENGFNGNVSFACSGLPAGATCSFSMLTVPTPAGVTYSTLTVSTLPTTAAIHKNGLPLFPESVLAVALCCFGWKKRQRLWMLLLLAVSMASLGLLNGCGGSSGGPPPIQPVTSTITVTATSGSLSHSTTFSLTVN